MFRARFLALVASVLFLPMAAYAIDVPVPGRTGRVRFDKKTGDLKVNESKSKPLKGQTFVLPAAGSADDPRIVGGSFLRCQLGDSCSTIALPSGGWIGLGNPAGSKGYKYIGAGTPADPCVKVLLKKSVINVKCKGPGGIDPSFTLPVAPDSVSDELVLGTIRYCNRFDPPYQKDGGQDPIWKAKVSGKDATAPASCPIVVPTPTPMPTATPTPTPPPPYGSASKAFAIKSSSLLD